MKYLVVMQGGEGPDVWDKEKIVDAANFCDAAGMADGLAAERGGHVVELALCDGDYEGIIKRMVDRFLAWKLPKDFAPDAGISFCPCGAYETPSWPIGTNLFTAEQATKMVDRILGFS